MSGRHVHARVVASFGRHFLVRDSAGELRHAVRRGKRGDVVVGDTVECSLHGQEVAIERVEPRHALLYRADAFRTKELAANVDQVAIVFAPQPPANPHFLWRARVAAASAGIETLAVLNKVDLDDGLPGARAALAQLSALGCRTVEVSVKREPDQARARLAPLLSGRATVLVGQSGMGKSSLLNLMVPDAQARTQEYSTRLNVGKQTTTATRWFDLAGDGVENGALVDAPGFQAFGLSHLSPSQLTAAMPDLAPLAAQCRFADCRHESEPGCAVRDAVESGALDPARLDFYRRVRPETAAPVPPAR